MPESPVAARPAPMVGERLEGLLADISGAPSLAAAAGVLAESVASAVGSPAVRIYALDEGDPMLRLVGAAGDAAEEGSEPRIALRDDRHPLVLATLSLSSLACADGALLGCGANGGEGAWVVIPLPQPMAAWSPAPLDLDALAERAEAA